MNGTTNTEQRLIRDLITYARGVNAEHATYGIARVDGRLYGPIEHVWKLRDQQVVLTRDTLIVQRGGSPALKAQVANVEQVAQMLAAIDVIPVELSPGYEAGWNDCAALVNTQFDELKLASQDGVA